MKKLLFFLLVLLGVFAASAQTDSLQQYAGKYKFPEGSPVTEVGIVLENGVLMATSVMGNSELRKIEGDVFEIVSFGGTATFRRNQDNKVVGLSIEVQDVRMEGTRTEFQGYYFHPRLLPPGMRL
jgi:hypothetical protein